MYFSAFFSLKHMPGNEILHQKYEHKVVNFIV
jgi:hypothetical protein